MCKLYKCIHSLLLSYTYAFTPCSWALHMQPQFTLEFYICTHKLPESFTYICIHNFAPELHICIHNCPRALHMQPQFAFELYIYMQPQFTLESWSHWIFVMLGSEKKLWPYVHTFLPENVPTLLKCTENSAPKCTHLYEIHRKFCPKWYPSVCHIRGKFYSKIYLFS